MGNDDFNIDHRDPPPPSGGDGTLPCTAKEEKKIIEALKKGASTDEICLETGIDYKTVLAWFAYGDNMIKAERIRKLPAWEAKKKVVDNIKESTTTAMWFLTHHKESKGDWSERREHTGEGGKDLIPITDDQRAAIEKALTTMDDGKKG